MLYIVKIYKKYFVPGIKYIKIKEKLNFLSRFGNDPSMFGYFSVESKNYQIINKYYEITSQTSKSFIHLFNYRYADFLSYFEVIYENLLIISSESLSK